MTQTATSPESGLIKGVAESREHLAKTAQEASDQLERAITGMGAPASPEQAEALKGARERLADLRKRIGEVGTPDVGLRPYMTPSEKASAGEVLTKFVALLGTAATAFGGGSRDSAGGALAALTGAMKGWAEGDRERAQREMDLWRVHTEQLLTQYALEQDEYKTVLTDMKLSWDQKVSVVNLLAQKNDNKVMAEKIRTEGLSAGLKEFEDRANWAHSFQLQQQQVDNTAKLLEYRLSVPTLARQQQDAMDAHRRLQTPSAGYTAEQKAADQQTVKDFEWAKAQGPLAAAAAPSTWSYGTRCA
jgi:hypothetical protein